MSVYLTKREFWTWILNFHLTILRAPGSGPGARRSWIRQCRRELRRVTSCQVGLSVALARPSLRHAVQSSVLVNLLTVQNRMLWWRCTSVWRNYRPMCRVLATDHSIGQVQHSASCVCVCVCVCVCGVCLQLSRGPGPDSPWQPRLKWLLRFSQTRWQSSEVVGTPS